MKFGEFVDIIDNTDRDRTATSVIYKGLSIMREYIPEADIHASGHDVVYSVTVQELVDAGISKYDVLQLAALGWRIDFESMAHFV